MRHQMFLENEYIFDCINMYYDGKEELFSVFEEAGLMRPVSEDEDFCPLDYRNLSVETDEGATDSPRKKKAASSGEILIGFFTFYG